MLNKAIGFFKDLYKKQNEEFERMYIKENYNRLIPALLILYIAEWGLYLIEHKIFYVGEIILIYQGINTVVIIVLIFINRRFEEVSISILKAPIYLWTLATLFFGIVLVFSTQSETDLIHMYMMMALGIAAFVCMSPLERLVILAIPTLFFFFGLPYFQSDVGIVNVGRINVLIFTFFILLLAYNLYFLKYKEFLSKKELVEKNVLLEKLSKTDLMTNLYNHKTILEILNKNMEESKRYGNDLSIILIDIDDFKRVNDNFGHALGDETIIMLADVLRMHTRITDEIGRYGGEEFLVIMPDTNLEGARNYYLRIQESLRRKALSNDVLITISAGTAFYQSQDITNFLVDADKNLYKAKNLGKDRCI
jgi:diguanylate cyclase (GGDEF)-like protein